MKRIALYVLMLFAFSEGLAAPVSKEKAHQIAEDFMVKKGRKGSLSLKEVRTRLTRSANEGCYYIYNVGDQQGFVIVSGDDRTPEILGYAMQGCFETDNMPENLSEWMEGYAEQIRYLQENGQQTKTRGDHKPAIHAPIADMIQTKWTQRSPFNDQCPVFESKNCLTGCVATAMAQVMYYHKWPTGVTQGIPGYTTSTNKIAIDSLIPTTFDWNNMSLVYNNQSSATTKEAVAHLLKYCGFATQADYGTSGTSASTSKCIKALRNYFGYGSGMRYISREYYEDDQWDLFIYHELEEQRPVIYRGQKTEEGGGHAFVIHGYDGNGYYAVNWGWGGSGDGYYLLSAMNPNNSESKYNLHQSAAIGISKENVTEPTPVTIIRGAYVASPDVQKPNEENSLQYEGNLETNGSMPFRISLRILSDMANTYQFDLALSLMKDGKQKDMIVYREAYKFQSNQGFVFHKTLTLNDLKDGDYQLKAYCRESGAEEWKPCICMDKYIINIHVDGQKFSIKVADTTTAIRAINQDVDNEAIDYFDLNGHKVDATHKGIMIIKMKNGTSRKVIR